MISDPLATVAVGDTASCTCPKITTTDIVRYAGASGDFNPIHHDESYARSVGLPQIFSMGMFQAGLLTTFATDWLGVEQVRALTFRFKEQVWPGDELTCTATVTERNRSRVVVDVTCSRQTGGVAVQGTVEFELPAASPDPNASGSIEFDVGVEPAS